MFFFFHLLVGAVTGFLLSDIFRSKRWFLPVAIGSILPDLIDKPLGHIIFAESIGNGRIIAHSLLFLFIILVIAFIWSNKKGSIIGFGVVALVLIHQILDSMWVTYQTWFFPLYGFFPKRNLPDYFTYSFWHELTSPQEWFALILLILIGLVILGEWYYDSHPLNRWISRFKSPLLMTIGMITAGIGLYLLFNLRGIKKGPLSLMVEGGDPILLALALIWCGIILLTIAMRRTSLPEIPA